MMDIKFIISIKYTSALAQSHPIINKSMNFQILDFRERLKNLNKIHSWLIIHINCYISKKNDERNIEKKMDCKLFDFIFLIIANNDFDPEMTLLIFHYFITLITNFVIDQRKNIIFMYSIHISEKKYHFHVFYSHFYIF